MFPWKRLRLAAFALLFAGAVPGAPGAADDVISAPAAVSHPFAEGTEAIRARSLAYLLRHGDSGRIDPERRLEEVREEYRRRLASTAVDAGGGKWRSTGPTNGAGRMVAIAPHPTATGSLLAGAADGGVWKTTNGGASWSPLTDSISDLSVGAVAIAPSSPDVIYVGSGEGGLAIDFVPGIGFLKSTDGGRTWVLPSQVLATGFYRISVHPAKPQELVVGTNEGGFRSTDGGASWTQVISKQAYGAVTDIVRDPHNAQLLYATTWDEGLWCARGGCDVSSPRVLKSTDGGRTWIERSAGIPDSTASSKVDRMSIAITPSNPDVLYVATVITDSTTGDNLSHIYKTTDGAASWKEEKGVSSNPSYAISHYLAAQAWYDNCIVVSSVDPNVIVAGGVYYIRSTDGGQTWKWFDSQFGMTGDDNVLHVDAHDLRYQGDMLYIANDGGIWRTTDDGKTAFQRNDGLVTRQFYALANDPADRNRVFAGTQDNGTSRRPDTGSTRWDVVLAGDGFECGFNPAAPSVAYATAQGARIYRTKEAGAPIDPFKHPNFYYIFPPYPTSEFGGFLSTLTIDPSSPATIYTGTQRVWRSRSGGDTWEPLPTVMTDGSTWPGDNISAIAVAQANNRVLMISKSYDGGNAEGRVFRSTDGGDTWRSASSGLPGSRINNVEIDPRDADTAYAAIAGMSGEHVYQTVNGGLSWAARGEGLPDFSAQVVRVDPTNSNILYCGTDVGVYRSTNRGASWSRFGTGLPASSVQDLRMLQDDTLIRVATHGRGVWEMKIPTGNTPPTVSITSPSGPETVPASTSIRFVGTISASADPVTGTWAFPDTWETVAAGRGESSVSHTFFRAGTHPVTLTARDSQGAVSSSEVMISVPEKFDPCSTPAIIPPDTSFPWTVPVNNEASTRQASDPLPPCLSYTNPTVYSSTLWFEFTPSRADTYEFSTCGAGADTVLSLWTGPACGPYKPVAAACNDNAPEGTECYGYISSEVTRHLSAGQTVRLLLDVYDYCACRGSFTLTVRSARKVDAPRITSSFPYSGSSRGGTVVTIAGRDFASGAAVSIGGKPATGVVVTEGKFITATTGAHPAGPADVIVTNPNGSRATLSRGFMFVRS